MRKIKRIGVLSLAKIHGAVMFCVALVIIVPFFVLMSLFGAMASMGDRNPFGALGAVGGILLALAIPVLYGCLGFVMGAITAFVYNIVAGWGVGVQVGFGWAWERELGGIGEDRVPLFVKTEKFFCR